MCVEVAFWAVQIGRPARTYREEHNAHSLSIEPILACPPQRENTTVSMHGRHHKHNMSKFFPSHASHWQWFSSYTLDYKYSTAPPEQFPAIRTKAAKLHNAHTNAVVSIDCSCSIADRAQS